MIQLFSGRGSGGLPPIHPYVLPPFLGLYCHAAQWCTGVLVCAGELLYNAARLSAQRSVCICRGGACIFTGMLVYARCGVYIRCGEVLVYAGRFISMGVSKRRLTYRGVCLCMQAIVFICRWALIYAGDACICEGVLVYKGGCLYVQGSFYIMLRA